MPAAKTEAELLTEFEAANPKVKLPPSTHITEMPSTWAVNDTVPSVSDMIGATIKVGDKVKVVCTVTAVADNGDTVSLETYYKALPAAAFTQPPPDPMPEPQTVTFDISRSLLMKEQ